MDERYGDRSLVAARGWSLGSLVTVAVVARIRSECSAVCGRVVGGAVGAGRSAAMEADTPWSMRGVRV